MTSLKGAAEPPYGLAFGPDLATLVMADEDGGLTVWDTKTGARVSTAKVGPGVVAFSPDGKWLATYPSEDKAKPSPIPVSLQVWSVGKPADK